MTKNFHLLIFSGAVGIRVFCFKKEYIENMLPICVSYDVLNVCSEPFVMTLNVRAARLASSKVKSITFSYEGFDRIVDPW